MPVKVTGGDCQEMLKLLPLGVNFADPGMFTGGVACVKRKYYSSKKNSSSSEAFRGIFHSFKLWIYERLSDVEKNCMVASILPLLEG